MQPVATIKPSTENTLPEFIRIVESLREEVSRHDSLTSTINNQLNAIKSVENPKVISELKQESAEPTFVGAVWDLIFRLREINDRSERNKDRLSEIV